MNDLKDELLKEFLPQEEVLHLESLNQMVQQDKIIVTCMGLYNHGKSTLLNALIGDFNQEVFQVADVRQTVKNKSFETPNNIIFVDTPGLNASKHDDKRAMDAAKESDINLFVHTITTGEFTKKEIDFLHKVKSHWKNPKEFIERTIFVISRIDKLSNKCDINTAIVKMKKQIKNIFAINSTFIPISALRYINGKKGNKRILIKNSNLEKLTLAISELRKRYLYEIKQTKRARLQKYYDDLINKFNTKLQENKLQLTELKRVGKKIKKDIDKAESTLEQKYRKLNEEL